VPRPITVQGVARAHWVLSMVVGFSDVPPSAICGFGRPLVSRLGRPPVYSRWSAGLVPRILV